jgi:hypothetical protein
VPLFVHDAQNVKEAKKGSSSWETPQQRATAAAWVDSCTPTKWATEEEKTGWKELTNGERSAVWLNRSVPKDNKKEQEPTKTSAPADSKYTDLELEAWAAWSKGDTGFDDYEQFEVHFRNSRSWRKPAAEEPAQEEEETDWSPTELEAWEEWCSGRVKWEEFQEFKDFLAHFRQAQLVVQLDEAAPLPKKDDTADEQQSEAASGPDDRFEGSEPPRNWDPVTGPLTWGNYSFDEWVAYGWSPEQPPQVEEEEVQPSTEQGDHRVLDQLVDSVVGEHQLVEYLDHLDHRLGCVETHFDTVPPSFEELDGRVAELETSLQSTTAELREGFDKNLTALLEARLAHYQGELGRFQDQVQTELAKITTAHQAWATERDTTLARFLALEKKVLKSPEPKTPPKAETSEKSGRSSSRRSKSSSSRR